MDGTGAVPVYLRKLPSGEVWQSILNPQLFSSLSGLQSQGSILISTPDTIYLSLFSRDAPNTLFRLSRCGRRVLKSLRVAVDYMCLHNDLLYIVAQAGQGASARLDVRDPSSLEVLRSIRYPRDEIAGTIHGIAVVERPAPVGGGERIFLTVWTASGYKILVLKEQVPGEAHVVRDVRSNSESWVGPPLEEPTAMMTCGEYIFVSEYTSSGSIRILSYDGTHLHSIPQDGLQISGLQICPSRRRLLVFGPLRFGEYFLDEYEVPWMKAA